MVFLALKFPKTQIHDSNKKINFRRLQSKIWKTYGRRTDNLDIFGHYDIFPKWDSKLSGTDPTYRCQEIINIYGEGENDFTTKRTIHILHTNSTHLVQA